MLLQTTWATNSKRSIGSIISEMKLNDEFMYVKPELVYDEFIMSALAGVIYREMRKQDSNKQ